MYTPIPIKTDDIILSDELEALIDKIAEHVHDIWAAGRIKEGWTYGDKRNDDIKTTPCLLPYSELSNSEKEYDRSTARGTLKLITQLGYKIIPPK